MFGAIEQDTLKTINVAFSTKFPLSKYFLEPVEETATNSNSSNDTSASSPLRNGPHAHLNGYADDLKGHEESEGQLAVNEKGQQRYMHNKNYLRGFFWRGLRFAFCFPASY